MNPPTKMKDNLFYQFMQTQTKPNKNVVKEFANAINDLRFHEMLENDMALLEANGLGESTDDERI